MRTIRRAAAALVLASVPAAAVAPFRADPRIELLGVVQYMSGVRPDIPMDEDYRSAVAKRFSPFVAHPAVVRWRENGESWAIDVLCLSDPPELIALPSCATSERRNPEQIARWRGFLAALRDFARRSDFMKFYDSHRSDYKRISAAASSAMGAADPVDVAEKYLGLSLDIDARWIVSPLFVPGPVNANISPYPNPTTLPDPGKEPFQATTLIAYAPGPQPPGATITQHSRSAEWRLPLIVFVEPALNAFASQRSSATLDAQAKDALISALTARLSGIAAGAPTTNDDKAATFVHRLEEYEKNRQKWPTLWDFFPRLLAVVPESPVGTPIKRVKDFFPARRAVKK